MPDFDPRKAARTTDPATSHAAAQAAGELANEHYRQILASGGGTIYEIAMQTGLDHVAVARRMPELQTAGKASPSGETRKGPTGRRCRVWVILRG